MEDRERIPLAERMRPSTLAEVVGQEEIIGPGKILSSIVASGTPVNIIFWGPPGTGKTTLARIIAKEFEADFIEISAVAEGKADVMKVIEKAKVNWNLKIRTVLFVDEIHRFNKAQQDAFLPHVESGLITLIGATTENPSFEIINPLLSRSRVVVLKQLSDGQIEEILWRAVDEVSSRKKVDTKAVSLLARLSGGDSRYALSTLEVAFQLSGGKKLSPDIIEQAFGKKVIRYDKKGGEHSYNTSAFIKSMRAGDATAALYYMARMVAAGEDAKFIARRMVVFASEDIGLAGNGALGLALNGFMAVERIGMPEGGIVLSHVVTALCRSHKSRESYEAWAEAKSLAEKTMDLPVPMHLRNADTKLMASLGFGRSSSGDKQEWSKGYRMPGVSYLPDRIDPSTDFFSAESQKPHWKDEH